jgi:hypothetical protein
MGFLMYGDDEQVMILRETVPRNFARSASQRVI